MNLLLTNDDGIAAPGLEALLAAARELGEPTVVAPMEGLSGCSHRVTTDGPVRLVKYTEQRYAVAGTPADCVRIALHRLVPDTAWILSGINRGGNLGADVYYSGTVAAIREGVLHGWPGIAVSQYNRKGQAIDWQLASRWILPLLRDLIAQPWTPGTFWNINLPHPDAGAPRPEVVYCPLDPTPLPLSYRSEEDWLHYDGDYHARQRSPGADVDICFSGKIAVTLITLL